VAGMDMLNDMFQRQARRLETQLYQRAQDLRTIEMTQRQAAHARAQVRQLEQHHLEQAARISQGAKSLQRLQDLIRESILSNNAALGLAEAHERELADLREELRRDSPEAAAKVARLRSDEMPSLEQLRHRAFSLENALAETERSAMLQIGVTPPTSVAMSSDCNPLHDLSAVADYAAKAMSPSATPVSMESALPSAAPAAAVGMMVDPPAVNAASMRGMLPGGVAGGVRGCCGHMGAAAGDGAAYQMRGSLGGGMCGCHGRPASVGLQGGVPGGLSLGMGGGMACGMGMGSSSMGGMGGGIGSTNSSALPSPMAALSTQSPRRSELPASMAEGLIPPASLRPQQPGVTHPAPGAAPPHMACTAPGMMAAPNSCGLGHPSAPSAASIHGPMGSYVQGYGGGSPAVAGVGAGAPSPYQQLSSTPRLQS